MAGMGKLTAASVARTNTRGLYSDGCGLYLRVAPGGSKQWVFRFRVDSKQRYHGLGSMHTLTLSEAREAALRCRKQRLDGLDPIETR